MKCWLYATGRWLEARLHVRSTIIPSVNHPIPRGAAGPMGWWYVFGSASLTLLLVQILTGIGLAMVYVPSADKAYESLLYLNYDAPFGWFLRAVHFWGSNGMVAVMTLHNAELLLSSSRAISPAPCFPSRGSGLRGSSFAIVTPRSRASASGRRGPTDRRRAPRTRTGTVRAAAGRTRAGRPRSRRRRGTGT